MVPAFVCHARVNSALGIANPAIGADVVVSLNPFESRASVVGEAGGVDCATPHLPPPPIVKFTPSIPFPPSLLPSSSPSSSPSHHPGTTSSQEIDSIRKELEEAQLDVQRLNESLELLRMERDSVNAENHRLMNAVSDAASASGSQGSGDGRSTIFL